MSTFDQVKSRPISQLPLIGSMIDGALNDTRDHLQTLVWGSSLSSVISLLGPFNVNRAEGEPALVRGNVALRPCIR
jgi:hypothetical protein